MATIVVIWSGVYFFKNEAYEHAYEAGARQGTNLTRIFAEYISRVVKGTDSQLLFLRELYEKNPNTFDLAHWVTGTKVRNDLAVQFAVAGPDGLVTHSSIKMGPAAVNVKDRAYFRFHASTPADEPYIGPPVFGRVSHKSTIQLTRRLTAPDGSFGGVILASLDIVRLGKFYNSIDIGRHGVITLVGLDGIIRARSGNDPKAGTFIGRSIAESRLFEHYRGSSSGNYWNAADSAQRLDGVRRLISYRVVDGLPLLAVVAAAESDIFQQARSDARNYYRIGIVLTAFVLAAVGFAAARQHKLNSATTALKASKRSLEQTNVWFNAALENMAHGLCMFDRDQRLIVCNRRYGEMYGLTPEQTKPGTTLRTILDARVAAGHSPVDAQGYIANRLEEVGRPEPYYAVNELRDGRVYAVNHQPMRDGGWVAIHQDITKIRLAEARADSANREMIAQRHAIDEAVMVTVTDLDGRITYANEKFCRISGHSREELLGKNHRVFKSGVHPAEFFRAMYARITAGKVWRGEICNKAKDGSLHWLDTTIVPRAGQGGSLIGYMATRFDITARKEAEAQIAYMARHDALTGVANRAMLQERINESLDRLQQGSEAFALFMLDLDFFKVVNDSLGHLIGDELLKEVANRLSACVRETDVVARLGGDEFAVLMMTEEDLREAAIRMAQRLLDKVSAPYDLGGQNIDIGTSIGIAFAPENGTNVEELMKCADLALYKAKSAGRNGYILYDAAMGAVAKAHRALEVDLRNALIQDKLELHYHPIVEIETRQITGVEALIRWPHPERGLIAPDDFIPLAEETGLIVPLGEWVLQKACAQAVDWPPDVKIAVNLSAVQFRKGDLVAIVSRALTESGLDPERLELEVTESVLMQASADNVSKLHQLRSFGVAIVLDDFGTGYASLSYLRTFPFSRIKMDRSFVSDMTANAGCAAIVSAVAGLGRGLHVDTIAEGIETEDQFLLVQAAGFTHTQGFLFGRPCPASELQFGQARMSKERAA